MKPIFLYYWPITTSELISRRVYLLILPLRLMYLNKAYKNASLFRSYGSGVKMKTSLKS